MKRLLIGLMGGALAIAASVAAFTQATAATPSGTVNVQWHTQAIVKLTLTPNYASGFGQVKAVFGTQPAPTHGPDATGIGQGSVDFGSVLSGTDYLYKYAAHLNVATNDPGGFTVYGEGAANFYNTTDGSSQLLSSTLYYANSTSGSVADPNNGFTPGLPFQNTSGIVTPAQPNPNASPTINYNGTYPSSPIATSSTATNDFYYDYLMKVPFTATGGAYFVWIVYTVVAK